MSDTDSFIEEVTEEVRRDRLFALIRRYGWIAVLVVVAIVGGAAWNEYSKARDRAAAEALGDSILSALENDDSAGRVAALEQVASGTPGGDALLRLLIAAEAGKDGDDAAATSALNTVATNGDLPPIYRAIASYKMLIRQSETMSAAERRTGFEALANPGAPLRLLAEEQLALIDIEEGQTQTAIDRLNAVIQDSEVTAGLRQRASQLIVALGGEPSGAS